MKRILLLLGVTLLLFSCNKDEIVPDALISASAKTLKPRIKKDLIDFDGNVYKTVKIGKQEWMVENLKTIHYNNGNSIDYPGIDNAAWQNNTTGAYSWYDNDEGLYKETYGALYNWHAVNSGILCPTGWHVPSDEEWTILTTYLGGESIAADKLKEAGDNHWFYLNAGTNETGFTALPGGVRPYDGIFTGPVGWSGLWWSSTEDQDLLTTVWCRQMYTSWSNVERMYMSDKVGISVRCVKN